MTGDQQQPAAAATPGPEQRVDEIRKRADAATEGPWGWNSYSLICSAPLIQAETDDTPDYPETPRPGPPFFTDEDNAWLAQRKAAYEADSTVAWVPAHYGDTATGRHAADAAFIENARVDVPWLLDRLAAVEQERDAIAEHAVDTLMGSCTADDHHGVDRMSFAAFLETEGVRCSLCVAAERDTARAELAAERERNLPLRQRIKALQDEVDQVAGPLKRRIRVAEHGADFWKRTSFHNYDRWKALRSELTASQGREKALVEAIRAEDAWRDRQSMGQPRAASKTWVALRALAASTPLTEPGHPWAERTCGHPEDFRGLPPTTFRTACRCGQNYACPTCGFGSVCHPHTCPEPITQSTDQAQEGHG